MGQLTSSRVLRIGALVLVMCALIGLAVFGLLAWQAVTVEDGTRADAERRIAGIRAGLASKAPLVEIDDEGPGRGIRARGYRYGSRAAGPDDRRSRTVWTRGDRRSHES